MQNHMMGGHLADSSRGQGRILAILKMKDGISTKDLSYLLGIRISSLNETLGKLEKNGFIVREPSESDKRIILIRLTEKGENEEQKEDGGLGNIFACLSKNEQEVFGLCIDKIIAKVEEEMGDEEPDWEDRFEDIRKRIGDALFERWGERGGGRMRNVPRGGDYRGPGGRRNQFWKDDEEK